MPVDCTHVYDKWIGKQNILISGWLSHHLGGKKRQQPLENSERRWTIALCTLGMALRGPVLCILALSESWPNMHLTSMRQQDEN